MILSNLTIKEPIDAPLPSNLYRNESDMLLDHG
jgi:hypothetical protein